MKKVFYFLFSTLLVSSLFAQKPEVKNGQIIVDNKPIALIEKQGCKMFSPSCEFYISSLNSENLINVVADAIDKPNTIPDKNNFVPKIPYLRFSFTGFDKICEMENPSFLNTKEKDIAKIVARLIKDGQLDKVAVENFIKINGTPITDMLNREASKPTININIGR